jgi:outer membrane protein OmpA-like peptidoglycan-associated protein
VRLRTLALLAALLVARPARADVLEPFSVGLELGAGGMLPEHQRDALGLDVALHSAVRVGARPVDPLVVEVGYAGAFFPQDGGLAEAHALGGGLRLEPAVDTLGRFFVDAHANLVLTGPKARFGFDVGIGFELQLVPELGLGPFIRYVHAFAAADDFPSDGMFLVGGLSLRARGAPLGATRDRDGDGIEDGEDLCPHRSAGANADPRRPGCPAEDSDGDGIFDREDECPTTPTGRSPDPDRLGCPDGDRDADGVLDAADRCPDQPVGWHPDPERAGCPARDRDGDAVPDANDACPDVPGAPHPDPARHGCPGLARIEGDRIRLERNVFFATDSDAILERSEQVLQAIADVMVATPTIRRVSIEGHTDDVADGDYNLELSERRAINVMAWLVRHGVEAERLEAHGFGETRPLVPAVSDEARATNRRVEIRITDPLPEESPR